MEPISFQEAVSRASGSDMPQKIDALSARLAYCCANVPFPENMIHDDALILRADTVLELNQRSAAPIPV